MIVFTLTKIVPKSGHCEKSSYLQLLHSTKDLRSSSSRGGGIGGAAIAPPIRLEIGKILIFSTPKICRSNHHSIPQNVTNTPNILYLPRPLISTEQYILTRKRNLFSFSWIFTLRVLGSRIWKFTVSVEEVDWKFDIECIFLCPINFIYLATVPRFPF